MAAAQQSLPKLPLTLDILRQACARFPLDFEVIDDFSGYLVRVSNGRRHYFAADSFYTAFPLNSANAGVCRDKAFTKMILAHAGFEVVPGQHFFVDSKYRDSRPAGREMADALAFAERAGYPLFVKPNDGALGAAARMVNSTQELQAHVQQLAGQGFLAAMLEEPVLDRREYRLVVLDGEVCIAYQRSRPSIHGDGISTVAELLQAFRAQHPDIESTANIADQAFLEQQLRRHGLRVDSVLPDGRQLEFSAVADIRSGGSLGEVIREIPPQVHAWARRLGEQLGVRICGVDVFAQSFDDPAGYRVLEVNDRVAFHVLWQAGYRDDVLAIWHKVLAAYFGETPQ